MASTKPTPVRDVAGLCLSFMMTATAWAQAGPQTGAVARECSEYGPMASMWQAGGMHGWFHGFWVLVVLAVIVLAVLWAMRSTCRRSSCPHGPCERPYARHGVGVADTTQRALQILNERYARGEIEKTDFEERRSAILAGQATPF